MYNRSHIIVDAHALTHNIIQYKKACDNKQLGIVVKSNAYGHGLELLARLLQENTLVDWLFVASLSEAITIRQCGVIKPILVMYHIDDDPYQLIVHGIDVMVTDRDTISRLNDLGTKTKKPIAIHIKVDTGLNRFGFSLEEIVGIVLQVKKLSGLKLNGIYTHLAEAAAENAEFTLKQITQFSELLSLLNKHGIHIPYKHVANAAAAGAFDLPETNLTRIGLGAYGHWPSPANKIAVAQRFKDFSLKPVLSWRSRIEFIRTINEGDCVGYDRTFIAARSSTIAIVPVGYFDGYDRRLSNKAHVLVNRCLAPVVGRIAMTTMMIDVTDIQVQVGDEVELVGATHEISPTTLSALMHSYNPRELLTRIHEKVLRVVR